MYVRAGITRRVCRCMSTVWLGVPALSVFVALLQKSGDCNMFGEKVREFVEKRQSLIQAMFDSVH